MNCQPFLYLNTRNFSELGGGIVVGHPKHVIDQDPLQPYVLPLSVVTGASSCQPIQTRPAALHLQLLRPCALFHLEGIKNPNKSLREHHKDTIFFFSEN